MRKITAILSICLCTIFLLSSCQKTAQKPIVPDNTKISGTQQTNDAEKRVMANRFSIMAAKVAGVQKATVVVSSLDSGTTGSDISGLNSNPGAIPKTTNNKTSNITNSNADGKMVVMVGLNIDSKIMQNKAKENSIKQEVRTKILADDKRISEVLVTTDMNMIKKLQDVAAGVIQGKPVQTYDKDIEELNKSMRGM